VITRRALGGVVLTLAVLAGGCGSSESRAPSTTSSPVTTSSTTSTTTTTMAAVSTTSTTTTVAADSPATAADLCALTPPSSEPVLVETAALTEASGIAVSRRHEGLLWAHNDSGDGARLYLLDLGTGADLGTWPLEGAAAFDWEDMALATTADGRSFLYAADFGDNFRFRPDIRIHRAEEPTEIATPEPLVSEELIFTYPDGATDAESLFIDPDTGDVIVIAKSWDDSPTSIYRGPSDTEPGMSTELEKIGEVDLTDWHPLATAADISADGRVIGLRTIDEVLLWDRPAGVDIATAMAGEPCRAPSIAEPQGEALAFLPDGSGYVTISEGANPPIHVFRTGRPAD